MGQGVHILIEDITMLDDIDGLLQSGGMIENLTQLGTTPGAGRKGTAPGTYPQERDCPGEDGT